MIDPDTLARLAPPRVRGGHVRLPYEWTTRFTREEVVDHEHRLGNPAFSEDIEEMLFDLHVLIERAAEAAEYELRAKAIEIESQGNRFTVTDEMIAQAREQGRREMKKELTETLFLSPWRRMTVDQRNPPVREETLQAYWRAKAAWRARGEEMIGRHPISFEAFVRVDSEELILHYVNRPYAPLPQLEGLPDPGVPTPELRWKRDLVVARRLLSRMPAAEAWLRAAMDHDENDADERFRRRETDQGADTYVDIDSAYAWWWRRLVLSAPRLRSDPWSVLSMSWHEDLRRGRHATEAQQDLLARLGAGPNPPLKDSSSAQGTEGSMKFGGLDYQRVYREFFTVEEPLEDTEDNRVMGMAALILELSRAYAYDDERECLFRRLEAYLADPNHSPDGGGSRGSFLEETCRFDARLCDKMAWKHPFPCDSDDLGLPGPDRMIDPFALHNDGWTPSSGMGRWSYLSSRRVRLADVVAELKGRDDAAFLP